MSAVTEITHRNVADATPSAGEATSPIDRIAGNSSEHLGGVDWLRIIGIAAIVYYHAATIWYPSAPGYRYAFAGLHALTAAAIYFAAASRSAKSDADIIFKRFNRVMVPWLAFSLIHMASAIHSHNFRTSMLWTGGSTHLWFLPFIFIVGCAVAMLSRRRLIRRSVPSAVGWSLASLVALALEPRIGPLLPKVEPVWQVVNAIPSALMGVAMYTVPSRRGDVILMAILAIAGAAVALTTPDTTLAWPAAAAAGAIAFGIARRLPIRATAASCFVGRASFGVYLMHMLLLAILVRTIGKLTHAHGEAISSDPYGLVVAAQASVCVVVCLAIVAVLERTPLRRFIG